MPFSRNLCPCQYPYATSYVSLCIEFFLTDCYKEFNWPFLETEMIDIMENFVANNKGGSRE